MLRHEPGTPGPPCRIEREVTDAANSKADPEGLSAAAPENGTEDRDQERSLGERPEGTGSKLRRPLQRRQADRDDEDTAHQGGDGGAGPFNGAVSRSRIASAPQDVPIRNDFGTPPQGNRISFKSPCKPSLYPSRNQRPWSSSNCRVSGR